MSPAVVKFNKTAALGEDPMREQYLPEIYSRFRERFPELSGT